ncbi:Chitinase 2 [Coemansia sp. RSA 1646]|nr:Chitinase 2 [Coemansia sp. RSA 1646]
MNGFPNVLLNFANACETTFDGSTLLHCPSMAEDIKYCQSQGKAVIISMGGASGAYGFYSEKQGTEFADTVWNMFFKGSADQRPFDDAVLDGIDLDIEGGSGIGYTAFIERLRSHYATDQSKEYYIAAAPQCPYPDAYLGSTLNSAWFDMVYVQFYNNYCGLNAYPSWFNFEDWDNWAKTASVNKDVKIFIGAPGSPSAASSGYVDGSRLSTIYNAVRAKYTSLGGIMTWDVSQARTSGLASSIRSMLDASGSCSGKPPYETTTNTGTTSSTNTCLTDGAPCVEAVYTTRGISSRIELVPLAASNGQFKALIKIQTLLQPISKHWVLELQMPKGQSIDHTSVGRLSAHYPKASIISADYDVAFPRMALSIEISGRYLGSYRIPNIALAKIDNY